MSRRTLVTNAQPLAEIQAAVDDYDVVEFAAGQVFQLTDYLTLKNPTRLVTSAVSPATIRRKLDNKRSILINSNDVSITNLTFDFNYANGWEDFVGLISFNLPDFDQQPQQTLVKSRFYGLNFVDSAGEVAHSENGDSWGIIFTNSQTSGGVYDTKVIGCRMLAKHRQLTAGGAGGGVQGCEIAYNYIQDGRSNAVAVSNRFNDGTEDDDVLTGIHIHHNMFIRSFGTSIFVGRDGNDDPDLIVSLSDITIEDNVMELAPGSAPFAKGALVKSGTSVNSLWSNVAVRRNRIINERAASGTSRTFDIKGPVSGGTVSVLDNICSGPGHHNVDNLTINQSGNTLNNDPYILVSS